MRSFFKLTNFLGYTLVLSCIKMPAFQAAGLFKTILSLCSLVCINLFQKEKPLPPTHHETIPIQEAKSSSFCHYNLTNPNYRSLQRFFDIETNFCNICKPYCDRKELQQKNPDLSSYLLGINPTFKPNREKKRNRLAKKELVTNTSEEEWQGRLEKRGNDKGRRLQTIRSEFFIHQTDGNTLTARFENQIDSHYHNGMHILVHECSFSSFSGLAPCVTRIDGERTIKDQAVYGDSFNMQLPVDFSEITSTNRLLIVCRRNNQKVVNFWVSLSDLSLVGEAIIAYTEEGGDRFNPHYVAYGLSLTPYPNGHFILGWHPALNNAVFMTFLDLKQRDLFPKQYKDENLGKAIPNGLMSRDTTHYILTNNGNARCTVSIARFNAGRLLQRNRIFDPNNIYGAKCIHMGIEKKSDSDKRYYIAAEIFLQAAAGQNKTAIFYLGSRDRTLGGREPLVTTILQQHCLPAGHRQPFFISTEEDQQVYLLSIYNNSQLHMSELSEGIIKASRRYNLQPYQLDANSVLKSVRYIASLNRVAVSIQLASKNAIVVYLPLAGRWQGPFFSVDNRLITLLKINYTYFGLIKTEYDCNNLDCFSYSFSSDNNLGDVFINFRKLLSSYDLVMTNYYTGAPTLRPTPSSLAPTNTPTALTLSPTRSPSAETAAPSLPPTAAPTSFPTTSPTFSSRKNRPIYRITFPKVNSFSLVDFQNLDAQNKALLVNLQINRDTNSPQLIFLNELGLIEEQNSRIYRMVLFSELYLTKLYPESSGGLSSTQAFVGYQGNEKAYRTQLVKESRSGEIEGVFRLSGLAVANNQVAWLAYNATHQFFYAVIQLNKESVYLLLCSLHFFDRKLHTPNCRRSSPKYVMNPVGEVVIDQEQVCGLLETKKFKDSLTSLLFYCWHMGRAAVTPLEIKENRPLQAKSLLTYQPHQQLTFVNIDEENSQKGVIYLVTLNTQKHHINCTLQHRNQQIGYAAASQDNQGNWYLAGSFQEKILLIQLKGCYAAWAVTWPLTYRDGIQMQFDSSSSEIMRLVIPERKALYYTYFYLNNGSNHLLQGKPIGLLVREVERSFVYQASNDIRFTNQRVTFEGGNIQSSTQIIARQSREKAADTSSRNQEATPNWLYPMVGIGGGITLLLAATGGGYYLYKKKRAYLN